MYLFTARARIVRTSTPFKNFCESIDQGRGSSGFNDTHPETGETVWGTCVPDYRVREAALVFAAADPEEWTLEHVSECAHRWGWESRRVITPGPDGVHPSGFGGTWVEKTYNIDYVDHRLCSRCKRWEGEPYESGSSDREPVKLGS